MRVLVTVSPQMYRQAVAASIRSARPGIEVRIAPPEDTEEQLRLFSPELLLYDDTAPIPVEALEGVPARVEVLYSDSMDARIRADGMVSRMSDMSTEDLLRTVAVAASLEDRP